MSTDLVKAETHQVSLVEMLQQVMERPNFDVAKADAFYGFVERMKKDEAEKAFGDAIETLHTRIADIQFVKDGKIPKGKKDEHGKYSSFIPFMTYEQVWRKCGPIFRELGITVRFTSRAPADGRGVIWKLHIRHRAGHEETSEKWMPALDASGTGINNLQQLGGADSYTQRYLLCKYLNIVTEGEDNDGASAIPRISDEQAMKLEDLIAACEMDKTGRSVYLNYMGIDRLSDIPERMFVNAHETLKAKYRKLQKDRESK